MPKSDVAVFRNKLFEALRKPAKNVALRLGQVRKPGE